MNFEQLKFMLDNVCFNGDLMIEVIPFAECGKPVNSARVIFVRDEEGGFGIPFKRNVAYPSGDAFEMKPLHGSDRKPKWLLTEDLHVTIETADFVSIDLFTDNSVFQKMLDEEDRLAS